MLIDELVAAGPVVLDGAWGTLLQSKGLSGGACPDGWNLSHPDRVEEVAAAYVAAGSQVILTNTFRANRISLAGYDLADHAVEINRRGVEISRRAAGEKARVFASIGPSGKMLVAGEISESELRDAFTQQAQALAEGGADAIVIETMAELEEAEIAVATARETGLPVVACAVFDSGPDKDRTMMGVTPEQAATRLSASGANAVGANCGQGIGGYVQICRRMRQVTDKPLWMKANAGTPEMIDGEVVYFTTAEQFAVLGPVLVEAGANFIGGCCGTSPEFVTALRKELEASPK
jgi:5-methyltetrahydrofolate--homocysteine methyltransferase